MDLDTRKQIPKERKCSYPGCNCESILQQEIKYGFSGKTIPFKFCFYHYYVVYGGHFKCIEIDHNEYVLTGPFKEVEITEQIMAAREMTIKYHAGKIAGSNPAEAEAS